MPQLNPQAGLGAMMQPAQTQKGMPVSNMSQIMSTAKGMSDAQLADVMAGKSMDVPQYVAMTEAMGRQQLRTAMQGAQAGQQVQQPTVKQKLLQTELAAAQPQPQPLLSQQQVLPSQQPAAGLAAAPAPNMESIGHAGGGIIAFGDGDVVKDPAQKSWTDYFPQGSLLGGGIPDSVKNFFGWGAGGREQAEVERLARNGDPDAVKQMLAMNPAPPSTQNPTSSLQKGQTYDPFGAVTTPQAAAASAVAQAAPATQAAPTGLPAAAAAKPGGGAGVPASASWEDLYKKTAERFKKENPLPQHPDRFEGMDQSKEDVAKQIASNKDQGLGAFMMQLGGKLLSTPGFGRAMGAGVEAGMPGVEATRKENLMLTKDQRDYQFNLAKAREAADQGKDELALKYAHAAEDIASKVGLLAVQDKTANAHLMMAAAAGQRAGGAGNDAKLTQKEVDAINGDFDKRWKEYLGTGEGKLAGLNPQQLEIKKAQIYDGILQQHHRSRLAMGLPGLPGLGAAGQGGGFPGGIDLSAAAAAELANRGIK